MSETTEHVKKIATDAACNGLRGRDLQEEIGKTFGLILACLVMLSDELAKAQGRLAELDGRTDGS